MCSDILLNRCHYPWHTGFFVHDVVLSIGVFALFNHPGLSTKASGGLTHLKK